MSMWYSASSPGIGLNQHHSRDLYDFCRCLKQEEGFYFLAFLIRTQIEVHKYTLKIGTTKDAVDGNV